MASESRNWLVWAPRILGIASSVFLGVFALDAFGQGTPLAQAVPDFVVHLAPALLLLAIVLVSWRREWIGGVAFITLAVGYAMLVRGRLDWIAVISTPLLLGGVLFLISWRRRTRLA